MLINITTSSIYLSKSQKLKTKQNKTPTAGKREEKKFSIAAGGHVKWYGFLRKGI